LAGECSRSVNKRGNPLADLARGTASRSDDNRRGGAYQRITVDQSAPSLSPGNDGGVEGAAVARPLRPDVPGRRFVKRASIIPEEATFATFASAAWMDTVHYFWSEFSHLSVSFFSSLFLSLSRARSIHVRACVRESGDSVSPASPLRCLRANAGA
jgi:hypothetical protein